MSEPKKKQLRIIDDPFVAVGPSGVAIRDRLKHLTAEDERVLRLIGEHQGRLASYDLKARCEAGKDHDNDAWAARKRDLTEQSSSRIAGSITKATHDQYGLARRCLLAHIHNLETGIRTLRHRLSLAVGEKGSKRAPGGYRSKSEWFHKSRRLHTLEHRLELARDDWETGRVRVVRGGRRLLNTRHNLDAAQLTEAKWRQRWEAERWFLTADGESGKRYGNETIRVTPDGEVSIKLPAPLAHLANAKHGRYVLVSQVAFAHRGAEWADRISGNRAVAYRIHLDVERGRWYLTASWQKPVVKTIPLEAARAEGMVGSTPTPTISPPTTSTRTATPSATPSGSSTTCPAPHSIVTPRSATPSPSSCTGPSSTASRRSASRTSTSRPRRPARSTAVGNGSGS